MSFPKDFVFGAATAAYQIEGAAAEDGRGPCVWDMFSHIPGKTWCGHTGDIACDHYQRYKEDISLMKQIGLQAYRFSIAWPRVLPEGRGTPNEKGLDFYDRLIDGLLEAGIEPYLTLFHWDFPYALYLRGGWLNPDVSDWFADYTRLLVDRYSDRVKWWMTLNEPQSFLGFGHYTGIHAPGLKYGFSELLRIIHNGLLAHGKATATIRNHASLSPKIGPVPVCAIFYPETERPNDIAAARKRTFMIKKKDFWNTTWWLDPILKKQYPEDGLRLFGKDMPKFDSKDLDIIGEPVDFIGHNHYCGVLACADSETGEIDDSVDMSYMQHTAIRWPVTPSSLYWSTKWLYEEYKLPIMISENGLSNQDWVSLDNKVHDPQRIDFLTRHLGNLKRAIEDGVPVLGYLQWSLMDNYEWAEGYKERFGLIYVDFETGTRILKDSAHWYADVIRNRGEQIATRYDVG